MSQVREHFYEDGPSASESVDHDEFGESFFYRLDCDLVDEVLAVGAAVQVDVFYCEVCFCEHVVMR
jgi:hypothetical protein